METENGVRGDPGIRGRVVERRVGGSIPANSCILVAGRAWRVHESGLGHRIAQHRIDDIWLDDCGFGTGRISTVPSMRLMASTIQRASACTLPETPVPAPHGTTLGSGCRSSQGAAWTSSTRSARTTDNGNR